VRPGDLILIRAIQWFDSGQLKRVLLGIIGSAAPIIYDLFSKNTLTWRSGLNALIGGLFVYIGISRAKAPDIVTGTKTLDKPQATVTVPAKLAADLAAANVKGG
jgi:hypothetical protein